MKIILILNSCNLSQGVLGLFSVENKNWLLKMEFLELEGWDAPALKAKTAKGWGLYDNISGKALVPAGYANITYESGNFEFTLTDAAGKTKTFALPEE